MMKKIEIHLVFGIIFAGLVGLSPVAANAGNVAWNVSVGGGYAGRWGWPRAKPDVLYENRR